MAKQQNNQQMEKEEKCVKVVMLGNSGVGKTSIVNKFCHNMFTNEEKPTIGAQFDSKTYPLESGKTLKFQIWDTAGQERYKCIASMYYKDSSVAIVVFDITCKASFDGLRIWIKELKEKAPDDIIIVIAANKSDLVENQVIDLDIAMEFAKEQNALFKLISAKESFQLDEMFVDIGKTLGIIKSAEGRIGSEPRESIKITGATSIKQIKKPGQCICQEF